MKYRQVKANPLNRQVMTWSTFFRCSAHLSLIGGLAYAVDPAIAAALALAAAVKLTAPR